MQPVILVVEDEWGWVELFQMIFPELLPGYKIIICRNCADALRSFTNESRVAGLIVDVNLPLGSVEELVHDVPSNLRMRDDSTSRYGGLQLVQEIAAMTGKGKGGFLIPTVYVSANGVPGMEWGNLNRLHALGTFADMDKFNSPEEMAERLLEMITKTSNSK